MNLLQTNEGESEAESLFDDAIAVAEVETGELTPTQQAMVETKDVATVTDENQVAPIEIDDSQQQSAA